MDWASFRRRCGGRTELVNKLVRMAHQSQQAKPEQLRHMAQAGQMQDLCMQAHTLRGVAGNLQALRLMDLAGALEHAAHTQSGDVLALTEQVAVLTEQFVAELADYARRNAN